MKTFKLMTKICRRYISVVLVLSIGVNTPGVASIRMRTDFCRREEPGVITQQAVVQQLGGFAFFGRRIMNHLAVRLWMAAAMRRPVETAVFGTVVLTGLIALLHRLAPSPEVLVTIFLGAWMGRGSGPNASVEAFINQTLTKAEQFLGRKAETDALNILKPILHDRRVEGLPTQEAKIAAYQRMASIVQAVEEKSSDVLPLKAQMLHQLALALSQLGQTEASARLFQFCFSALEIIGHKNTQLYLEISAKAHLAKGKAALNDWDMHDGLSSHLAEAAASLMTSRAYFEKTAKPELWNQQISHALSLLGWIHYHALWLEDQDPSSLVEKAGFFVQEALKLHLSAANALALRGTLLLHSGKADEAIRDFEEVLKLGEWPVARIGLLSALLQGLEWSLVANRFTTMPYYATLQSYAAGLQLARQGDALWENDRGQAVIKYGEACDAWRFAFGGDLVQIIGIRENYARAMEYLVRAEIRSGRVSDAMETITVFLAEGQIKFNSMTALIAEELPVEAYPDLAANLRSVLEKNGPAVARFGRLLGRRLMERGVHENSPSRQAMQQLVMDADPQGLGEQADKLGSLQGPQALAQALNPVEVVVPAAVEDGEDNARIAGLEADVRQNPEDARLHFNLAQAFFKIGRFDEAISSYQRALRYSDAFKGMAPELQSGLTMLWEIPEAAKVLAQMRRSRGLYERIQTHLEQDPNFLISVAYILNRLGNCCIQLARTRPEADARARNYFTAATWLTGESAIVQATTRMDTWSELSRLLSDAGEYPEALALAEQSQTLADQLMQLLTGGQFEARDRRIVSRDDLAALRADREHSLTWIPAQQAVDHFQAARALSGLLRWRDAANHYQVALSLGLGLEEEAVARLRLGWCRYHLVQEKKEAEEGDPAALQSALEDMDWIVGSGVSSDAPFHAAGLKHLVAARLQEWSGLAPAALQGLVSGCAAVLRLDADSIAGDMDALLTAITAAAEPLRSQIQSDREIPAVVRQFIFAMERLMGVLGQAGRIPDLQRAVKQLLPEPPAEKGGGLPSPVEAARTAAEAGPSDAGLQLQYAEALEKEGWNQAAEKQTQEAVAAFEESLVIYRIVGSLKLPHFPIEPRDRRLIERAWNSEEPQALIDELTHSIDRLAGMAARLRAGHILGEVVNMCFRMGAMQAELGKMHLNANDDPASARAFLCALALLSAAEVLARRQAMVPVTDRMQNFDLAGEAALQLRRREAAADYWARGAQLAADLRAGLEAGRVLDHMTNAEFAWHTQQGADRFEFITNRAVRMYFKSGIQRYQLKEWEPAQQAMARVREIGPGDLKEAERAVAETMLGVATYMLARDVNGLADPVGLGNAVQHMERVLSMPASDQVRFDACLIRGLARARLRVLAADYQGALDQATEDLAGAVGTGAGEPVRTLEQVLSRLPALGEETASSKDRLAELLHLAGSLAGQCGKPELRHEAETLAQAIEEREEKAESRVQNRDPEEALAGLREMIGGPLPDEPQTVLDWLNSVYNALRPLHRDQELLKIFEPAMDWMERQWVATHVTTPVFGLAWAFCLQADTFINLGRFPEAIDAVTLGFAKLNLIKEICRQNSLMGFWQWVRNSLGITHGKALLQRWEMHNAEVDLRDALDLLTPGAGTISGRSGSESANAAHADHYTSLGWAQYHLHGIERDKQKSARLLDQAEENAARALAANRKYPEAVRLAKALMETRQQATELLKKQNGLLASIDAAIETGYLETGAQQLDALEQSHWAALRVIYYRGMLAYQAARKSGDREEALVHDQLAVRIWSVHPPAELAAAWDAADRIHDVQVRLIEAQVRIGRTRQAIAQAWPIIDREPSDRTLAQRLVESLPDKNSYAALADEFTSRPPSPSADAFVRELANCLTSLDPAPAWREDALKILQELASPDTALQRRAEAQWAAKVDYSNKGSVDKFFLRDPWEPMSPQRKAGLLLNWREEFFKAGKLASREAAVVRYIDEFRIVVKSAMKKRDGKIDVLLSEPTLKLIELSLVTTIQAALNINSWTKYTSTQGAVRGLQKQIKEALDVCSLQILDDGFNSAEKNLKLWAAATPGEILIPAPQPERKTLEQIEKDLRNLRDRIPGPPVGQALTERYHRIVGLWEIQNRRVAGAGWLAIQEEVAHLPEEATDADLAAVEARLDKLRSAASRITPEPANLPEIVRRHFEEKRLTVFSARRRIADQGIAAARRKLAEQKSALEALDLRRVTVWERFRQTLTEARGAIDRHAMALTAAGLRNAAAKHEATLNPLLDSWADLERRAATETSLTGVEADGIPLIAASKLHSELNNRVEAWPGVLAAGQKRIQRNLEMAKRFDDIINHPITRALLPKGPPPESVEKVVKSIVKSLNAPALEAALYAHFLTWLTSDSEADWAAHGLDPQTGYAISDTVRERLSTRTNDYEGPAGLERRRRVLEKSQEVIKGFNKAATTPVRATGGPPRFLSSFELDRQHTVQCEFEMTDWPAMTGQARPILLRLGPTTAQPSAPIRMAVLLPTPAKGATETQATAILALEPTLRTAVLMGLGFSQAQASAVAPGHRGRNFDIYRLHDLGAEDLQRLIDLREAQSRSGISAADEALRRPYLAMLLAECPPERSLAKVVQAITEVRKLTPVISSELVRTHLGEALELARYDFIYSRLTAAPLQDSPAPAMKAVIQELGALFDEFIDSLVLPVALSGDGMAAVAKLRKEYSPMVARHEAAEEKRLALTTGLPGLLERLKILFFPGGTLEEASRWVRHTAIVLTSLDKSYPAESIELVKGSLAAIQTSIDSGEMTTVYGELYNQLWVLNQSLFFPAGRLWLWLEYDEGFEGVQGAHVDEASVMQFLPLPNGEIIRFVLTSSSQPPHYWHSERLALISTQWLQTKIEAEVRRFGALQPDQRRDLERRTVEREVLEFLAGAMDTVMMRRTDLFGEAAKSSQGMRNMAPKLDDNEIHEFAQHIRRLLMIVHSEEEIKTFLTYLGRMAPRNRAAKFALDQLFDFFRVMRHGGDFIGKMTAKLIRQGTKSSIADLHRLASLHVNLPVAGILLPEWGDGGWILPVPMRDLLEAIYREMGLSTTADSRADQDGGESPSLKEARSGDA